MVVSCISVAKQPPFELSVDSLGVVLKRMARAHKGLN